MIQGAQSFNSGKPVPNNSFLYTFDENGKFTVASQGAPGYACTVVVLDVGKLWRILSTLCILNKDQTKFSNY